MLAAPLSAPGRIHDNCSCRCHRSALRNIGKAVTDQRKSVVGSYSQVEVGW